LAFLGSVPQASIGAVQAVAHEVVRQVPRAPVQITLDVIEYWRKPKVLCVTHRTQTIPDTAAVMLAGTLNARLVAVGFAPDLKPFRPHITLARKVPHPPGATAIEPVTWTFTDFVLVDSKTLPEGPVYTVLHRFSLGR